MQSKSNFFQIWEKLEGEGSPFCIWISEKMYGHVLCVGTWLRESMTTGKSKVCYEKIYIGIEVKRVIQGGHYERLSLLS